MATRKVLLHAILLAAFASISSTANASTIVGGGKWDLKATDGTFESNKISTGGSSPNDFDFTFNAAFKVCDVAMTMEDANGNKISPGANNGMTSVKVTIAGGSDQSKNFGATPVADGKIDLDPQINPNTVFHVIITAKTTITQVKFNISFSTKPAGVTTSCTRADLFEAGTQSVVARPIFALNGGVVVPVKNVGTSSLAFGRFELVGNMPSISSVSVAGKNFTVTMQGNYAFTLTGDSIGPSETIEVYIVFSDETSNVGAIIAKFNES